MDEETILAAIGSQEPSTFNEFLRALGDDCPERGDKDGWRELFAALEYSERSGLVEIERVQRKIDSLILTEAGAARVREQLDGKKGLFSMMR